MTYANQTLNDRAKQYGSYERNALIAQSIKAAMRNSPNWIWLQPCQRESLELIATKISRILNGNNNHVDSWKDIAGYATLVEDALAKA